MKSPIAWDLETHLIKPGMTAPRMVCLSMEDRQGNRKLFGRDEGLDVAERLIKEEFTVGHWIFFDLGVMAEERPHLLPHIFSALDRGKIHDTKIRQMMIDNCRGNLKFIWDEEKLEYKKQNYHLYRLVQRHLGYDIQHKKEGEDIWRLCYNELDGIPIEKWPKEARDYPLDDATEARGVWLSQERKDVAPDEIPGLVSQMQAAWALNLMGTWGMRTDPLAVVSYKRELRAEFHEHVKVCQEYGLRRSGDTKKGRARNMKAIRAVIEKWYGDNNRRMRLTPKGHIATDREQLTNTDHPGLFAVAESVRTEKLLTTYVAALERGTEVPLNPNYNPIIETFRTSCSGGMKINDIPVGMNVQNLPRKGKVRQCIIPRPGWVFVFCDYDTLEMLTLAQVCLDLFGYSDIANLANEAWKNGGKLPDFHLAMAAEMLGISYREAHDRYKAGDSVVKMARQGCKIGNYGLAGGMGWRTLIQYAKSFGFDGRENPMLTPDQAKKLYGGFRRKWSEMPDYFNYCGFLCFDGNAEHVVFERSGLVRGDVRYTAVCNGFFQHLAAMGAKKAVYDVVKECYCDAGSPLFGCRPWLFAHDEIGMEIPYEAIGPRKAHEAAMRLQEVMVKAMEYWCPDVPIAATVVMARRWYKGVDPVYENSILIPGKPEGKKWVSDA